jgi:hypothetical protein
MFLASNEKFVCPAVERADEYQDEQQDGYDQYKGEVRPGRLKKYSFDPIFQQPEE